MNRRRIALSASMAVVIFLLLRGGELSEVRSMVLAVTIHELGHIMPMLLMGMRPESLRIEPGGLCVRYCGKVSPMKELITVLSGPLAGILFALLVRNYPALTVSGEMSLIYSAFNLLPVSPLDGGRALEILHGGDTGAFQTVLAVSVCIFGAVMAARGAGPGLLCAGAWLVFYRLKL